MHNITITLKRSFAAVIDFALITAIILIIIRVTGHDPELVLASAWRSNIIGFGMLSLLEAIVVAKWRKTLGMALLGLSVRNTDGSNLSVGESFLRSFLVFALGTAVGVPFYGIVYIALGLNLFKLFFTGSAVWDNWSHTIVLSNKS